MVDVSRDVDADAEERQHQQYGSDDDKKAGPFFHAPLIPRRHRRMPTPYWKKCHCINDKYCILSFNRVSSTHERNEF